MKRKHKLSNAAWTAWQKKDTFFYGLARYAVLIGIGFVFLYPILYMIVNSFKSVDDLIDPGVEWLPTALCFDNFVKAFETLNFELSFFNSILTSALPAVFQTIACAVVGYGWRVFLSPERKQSYV